MKFKFFHFMFFNITTFLAASAQTGPGGVGNATNNVLWLDASFSVYSNSGTTLAVNNDNVQQWNDRSGNNKHAIQITAANRPNYITNSLNGFPTIRNTSANADRLVSTNVTTGNLASVWVVASYATLPVTNAGLIQATPTGLSASAIPTDKSIGMWVRSNTAQIWGRGVQSDNTAQDLPFGTTLSTATTYLINNVYRTNRIDQYVNNVASGNNATHNGTLQSWTDVSIGSQSNESWNGNIAEVIFYNIEVNAAQRIIIDNYLSAKYGLSLGSNDVYKQDNPANGNFDFEVAGIGRVNSTNIHNNAKGTGLVRIQNPTNLGDNEFLMWGHNNGIARATNTSDVPSGTQARFDRVWRVSEVNALGVAVNVGNINMRWDLNGLGLIVASDLRLLIDANNNGSFSDDTPISGAVHLGGGIYEFAGVSGIAGGITDNVRFTIGTIDAVQTVLPIELMSFSATNIDNTYVRLEWETISETNNEYFTIQKSKDRIDWTNENSVKGADNSHMSIRYEAFDYNPFPDFTFYRLKQTDFDGKSTYSESRKVTMDSYNHKVSIFPNPSFGTITIKAHLFKLSDLKIYNTLGQEVSSSVDILSQTESQVVLDLSRLNKGVYYVKTKNTVNIVYLE